jgi:hypothetical protein
MTSVIGSRYIVNMYVVYLDQCVYAFETYGYSVFERRISPCGNSVVMKLNDYSDFCICIFEVPINSNFEGKGSIVFNSFKGSELAWYITFDEPYEMIRHLGGMQ